MLFVSGGGNARQSAILDSFFFESCHRILYIPVGLKRNFSGYEGCFEWFNHVCNIHNFKIDDVEMCLYLEYISSLEQYDGIYIGGASDLLYLKWIFNKSKFADKLIAFHKNGGNIYGGSAGGIILGQCLNIREDKGLGILPFSILSHYTDNDEQIDLYFKKNNNPLIVLKEDSGFMYDNNSIQAAGFSDVYIFLSKSNIIVLPNNSLISL